LGLCANWKVLTIYSGFELSFSWVSCDRYNRQGGISFRKLRLGSISFNRIIRLRRTSLDRCRDNPHKMAPENLINLYVYLPLACWLWARVWLSDPTHPEASYNMPKKVNQYYVGCLPSSVSVSILKDEVKVLLNFNHEKSNRR